MFWQRERSHSACAGPGFDFGLARSGPTGHPRLVGRETEPNPRVSVRSVRAPRASPLRERFPLCDRHATNKRPARAAADFSSRETPARKAVPSPNARKAVPAPRRRARPTAGPSRRCGPRGQLGGRSRVTQTPSRRPSIKLCACSDNLPLPPSLPLPPRLAPPCPHRASGRA